MGKKDGNRKRKAEEFEEENAEEAELHAEIAALMAARNEKKQASLVGLGEAPAESAPEKVMMYNKEGMLKCIEEMDLKLPFAETLIVSQFAANVVNENDDIEREVSSSPFLLA